MTAIGADARAVTAGGTSRTPAPVLARRAGLVAVTAAVLFFCYWRQSQSLPVSSDGSANVLQAWDMLHGNLLLHNWWVSDVSFYTTELPQYMLIDALLGLGSGVVHVAAAMTYTLLVLLAAALARGADPPRPPREGLAKGSAQGRAGMARALLAGGIMLSPQLSATPTLLLSPDHTGTAVPLLASWLVIDRMRPRWYVPVFAAVAFSWMMVGDSDVLLTGIIPLVMACVARACPVPARRLERARGGDRRCSRRYELCLAAAAAAAGVAGFFAPRVLAALGGYHQSPVGTDTNLGQLQHGAWVTVQAFGELFGANVVSAGPAAEVAFAAVHLAGAAAVVYALVLAFRRFFRSAELIVPVFALAVVVNLAAYMTSTHAQDLLGAREIAAVLPLGAVLAGRLLGEPVLAAVQAAARRRGGASLRARARSAAGWLLVGAMGLLAAGYLATLGYGAAQPPASAPGRALAAWLAGHGLSDGLAGYWQANSTTVASGGKVLVSAVIPSGDGGLASYRWESYGPDYDPALHDADFIVAAGPGVWPWLAGTAVTDFGRPAQTYHAVGYTILVWRQNLLTLLAPGTAPPAGAHMYRMRRLATTSSAGTAQAAISPRYLQDR
ncbi:MAG: hypothetical protein JO132_02170 [Streptosporangiaceae bacterium]|nr:hypothetical protein [Streptosporangiaceae bacterium]